MSDGIHPSGPAQPSLQQAYETKGNPAETGPAEKASADANAAANKNAETTDRRVPEKQTSYEPRPSSSFLTLSHASPPPHIEHTLTSSLLRASTAPPTKPRPLPSASASTARHPAKKPAA